MDVRTDIETGFIRSTLWKSWPNNNLRFRQLHCFDNVCWPTVTSSSTTACSVSNAPLLLHIQQVSKVLLSACLSVCVMCARISHKQLVQMTAQFRHTLPVVMTQNSSDDNVQYVMYFCCCGWHHVFTLWSQGPQIQHGDVSSRVPDGGTSRTSENIVCLSLSDGSTGDEVAIYNAGWNPRCITAGLDGTMQTEWALRQCL